MAEVGISRVVLPLHDRALIAAGMEVVEVAGKDAALGVEFRPALLAVDRVDLFLVGAGVVVDHHVGIEPDAMRVRLRDQRFQLRPVAVPGLGSALLVEVAQVEVVVGVVAHRGVAGRLVDRRQPQRVEAGLAQVFNLLGDEVPPLVFLFLVPGSSPSKRPAS